MQKVQPDIIFTGLFANGGGDDFDVSPAVAELRINDDVSEKFRTFFNNVVEFDFPRDDVAPPDAASRTWNGTIYEDVKNVLLDFQECIEITQIKGDDYASLQRLLFITQIVNLMQ